MPEHVHLLIGEPPKGTPSAVLQDFEAARFSPLAPPTRPALFPGATQRRFWTLPTTRCRNFWEARFYDFNVWSQTKKIEKLHYMHLNPVKRELVAHPKDWPWSSFSYYADRTSGLVPIDSPT